MSGCKLRVKRVSGFRKEAEITGEVRPLGVTYPASCCTEVTSRATCCTAALPDYGLVLLLWLHVGLIWYLWLCVAVRCCQIRVWFRFSDFLLHLNGFSGFLLYLGAVGSGFGAVSAPKLIVLRYVK